MKRFMLFALLSLGGVFAQSPLQQAPENWRAKVNPFASDIQAKRAGAKLYARECAECHGEGGQGIGKAPPLQRADVSHAPPGAVFWVLDNGALWHGMPSFAHLPAPERWQIVSFVQSLSGPKQN
ncbi:MAG TPA: c-type cytochrome [Bryobacteraceae bacterium]|nr:c-type cytochrome [Bryobacteraceae bacterium]